MNADSAVNEPRKPSGSTHADLRFRLRNVQQKLSCALSFQSFEPERPFGLSGLTAYRFRLGRIGLAVDLPTPNVFGEECSLERR
jgi:hypothetical protein